MEVRILGGSARGKLLRVPESARPSPVRLRKALFDYLRLRYPRKEGFLDLYAGSGAVGLEAASEGFSTTLVEVDRQAVQALRDNARQARLEVQIAAMPVERFLQTARMQYQVVFAAPPYPHDLMADFVRIWESGLAQPGGLYIVQHPTALVLPQGERRTYGFNTLTIMEAAV